MKIITGVPVGKNATQEHGIKGQKRKSKDVIFPLPSVKCPLPVTPQELLQLLICKEYLEGGEIVWISLYSVFYNENPYFMF